MSGRDTFAFPTLDYEKTKDSNAVFREELMVRIFEPDRMIRLSGNMPLREYLKYYE
jgi:hypothetical protein